ncbi:MAG: nucleotidyltransferase family protein [Planctomycetota bacterium]
MSDADPAGSRVATAMRNACMMRLLERVALRCAERGVEVMALKGAVLLATVYREPGDRPMRDIDVLVRPDDLPTVLDVLDEMGGRPLEPWVTPDFCPRFYNEMEYAVGELEPVLIEPHVRPFRPLRLQCLMPDDAWWRTSVPMRVGKAILRRPSDEHMLLHLAAHVAMHGGCGPRWREDLTRWLDDTGEGFDWDLAVRDARAWRLTPSVRCGIELAGVEDRLPADAWFAIRNAPCNWRDRLMLRWAPGDHASPLKHVLGTLLTTPNLRRAIGFALAVTVPTREHMGRWYPHRHPGWLAAAHAWRVVRPLTRPFARLNPWKAPIEVMANDDGQPPRLCANRPVTPGTVVAHLTGANRQAIEGQVGLDPAQLSGTLQHLGVAEQPTVRLDGDRLIALRQLRYGDPITVRLTPDISATVPLPDSSDTPRATTELRRAA